MVAVSAAEAKGPVWRGYSVSAAVLLGQRPAQGTEAEMAAAATGGAVAELFNQPSGAVARADVRDVALEQDDLAQVERRCRLLPLLQV